jgi:uncharacterized integral membrane protein
VAILLVYFAVANRHWTDVSFDPFNKTDPWLVISMPTFLLLFAGIFIGMIVGGGVVWMRQGKWRKQARMVQTHTTSAADDRGGTSDTSALVPALRQPH